MNIRLFFAPHDFWIGVYVDLKHPWTVYICPVPMLCLRIAWGWQARLEREEHERRRQFQAWKQSPEAARDW